MLHLSCSADARYAPHSAALLHSALAHAGDQRAHVHYLHDERFPADAIARLSEMVAAGGGEITFHEIADERISGLPGWDYITPTMWYRIFLPELLPDVARILYLDVDTIVCDSLAPLFDLDLGDRYLAAVTNVFQLDHLHRPEALGLPDPRAYFNSGVLLLNLEAMRRDGCTEALRRCALERGGDLLWPDQDALNLVLGKRRYELHPRWNCMNSVLNFPWAPYVHGTRAIAEARSDPAILHFEGPAENKPWHYLCRSEWRGLYIRHRRETPWPTLTIEGRTPRNVGRRAGRAARARLRSGARRGRAAIRRLRRRR